MSDLAIESAAAPHVLCSNCKSFWSKVRSFQLKPEELSQRLPEHVLHSQHLSQIRSSASGGCHFCSILLGSIAGCTGDYSDYESDQSARKITHSPANYDDPVYVSIALLNETEGTFLLTLFPCEQGQISSHDQILNHTRTILYPSTAQSYTTVQNGTQSMWHTNTFSPEAARLVRTWISDCQTTHFMCWGHLPDLLPGPEQTIVRPRRVLDLFSLHDPSRIRLQDTENIEDLEYCCLSYSWGFGKPYVTTSVNIQEAKQAINVSNLPRLLRDVIEVVRNIGIQYLWIDALCIMQDGSVSPVSSEDWLDQAGKMNDIFGNSIFTIAAAEAFDGHTSLIVPRNPLSHSICRLDVDTELKYQAVPGCTPHCLSHTFDKARYHIDSRAWVFQERILSPRTVHITRNFMHLECRSEFRCEAASALNCHHSGSMAKADYNLLFAMFGPNGLDEIAIDGFLSYWHELVRKYSATNLSRPPDLLVALAGLVKQVQKQSHLTWSFGLWREHLLRDMMWFVRGGVGKARRERAPSWSWASIEVDGPQIIHEPLTEIAHAADILALPESSDLVRQPVLTTPDSRYTVKIRGLVKHNVQDILKPAVGPGYHKDSHRNCQGLLGLGLHPYCPFHPDFELLDGIDLHVVLLGYVFGSQQRAGATENWVTTVGLVLTFVAGSSQYQRVGYLHHDVQLDVGVEHDPQQYPLFEDSKVEEIEVV